MDKLVIPGGNNTGRWTFAAYRDATYYPVVAFLEGNNPYDVKAYMKTYPVGDVFPPYLPMTLLLHLPLGMLSFKSSVTAYFIVTLILILLLSRLSLVLCGITPCAARTFGLAALVLLSRPGQSTLILGECTAIVTVGMYMAFLYSRDNPVLAGLGVALTSFKPTFGVPLALLLLARRDFKPVLIGIALSAALSTCAAGVIAYNAGGITPFVASMRESYGASEDHPDSNPVTSPSRIDAKGLAGRLLGKDPGAGIEILTLIGIVGVGVVGVRRLRSGGDATQIQRIEVGLFSLVILTCIFHQPYDLLLLTMPQLALASGGGSVPWDRSPRLRWTLLALLIFPAFNYLGSATAFSFLRIEIRDTAWILLSSLNGAALLVGLFVYLKVAIGWPSHTPPGNA
jgi:hypothetical protein